MSWWYMVGGVRMQYFEAQQTFELARDKGVIQYCPEAMLSKTVCERWEALGERFQVHVQLTKPGIGFGGWSIVNIKLRMSINGSWSG